MYITDQSLMALLLLGKALVDTKPINVGR